MNDNYLTRAEADERYITKLESLTDKKELLEKITVEKTHNDLQDERIGQLQKSLDKINNNINKVIWVVIAIFLEQLVGLILK